MLNRRLKLLSLALFVTLSLGLYIVITVPGDNGWINSWKTNDSAQYVQDMIHDWIHGSELEPFEWDGKVDDKILVMGRLPEENVTWVETELPDWQHAIYTIPPKNFSTTSPASIASSPDNTTLPANKGHEAMAYLTYLIDHYDELPSIILFLHPHEHGYNKAWHVDARLHSNVLATRQLRLDTVRARGYVNMRCNPRPNCLYLSRNWHPQRIITASTWKSFWAKTSTPEPRINAILGNRSNIEEADPRKYLRQHFNLASNPYPAIGDPAGAQFAITRETAHRRPQSDYVALREWLLATDLDDEISGRVFEYLWHVLFGMPAILCYERRKCECDVYNRCE